jgi:pyruvate kinase
MKDKIHCKPLEAWDTEFGEVLIKELWALRKLMLSHQARIEPWLCGINSAFHPSAINLAHYLAMRRIDLRQLQNRLAMIGVSSLGRAESHVLANVDKVLGLLHRIAGRPWTPRQEDEPSGFKSGAALLGQHAEALFGPAPAKRDVRIMVTLPSEAAVDDALVEGLVANGMDIARINCAHDAAAQWVAMAERVRGAAGRAGRKVRLLMDLGGPKLRTGPIDHAPAVVKLKPKRDVFGMVIDCARLGLRATGKTDPVMGAELFLTVEADWLARLKIGERIFLTDARGAKRRLTVIQYQDSSALLECAQTIYLTGQTRLHLHHGGYETGLGDIPVLAGQLLLKRGKILNLVPQGMGSNAISGGKGRGARRATIACTLPEALASVRKGEHIWFDDGRIGGVIRRSGAKGVAVEITEARDGGEHLAADKGINLPDTKLDLSALTAKDLEDLQVVAKHADLVGMSFAQSASDVIALHQRLAELGAAQVGLILKIETRRGFDHLPEMLLAAMCGPAAGVMIARGDLAVECGYERMAEVQEEILWACEAAHIPVVWATQVLETLAKTGLPSRAEITDAAMGGRAECVMLNKGPHILDAMRTLDNILRRMQAHQSKKRPLLRALKSWNLPMVAANLALPTQPRNTGTQPVTGKQH